MFSVVGTKTEGRRRPVASYQLMLVAAATCAIVLVARGSWAQQSCQDCDQCMTNCVCQPDGSCVGTPLPNTTQCDDGDPCTTSDHCQDGTCVGGGNAPNTTSCDDHNDCTINDHCDGAGQCVGGSNKAQGDSCTFAGLGPCAMGTCVVIPGFPAYCNATLKDCGDKCHFCNPSTGQCEANTFCSLNPCSTGQCDLSTGGCVPGNEGATCDDGNVCTSNDRCQSGECVGTAGGTPPPAGTATPTPTATPVLTKCVGDCNGDGVVTVDEILIGVNIALGNLDVSACENFDANGDGQVTVDEILTAVNNALNGCPEVPATTTPHPTTSLPTSTPTYHGTPTATTQITGTVPPTQTPVPTTPGGGTPSIGARASGTIESTTSALLVIPNLIAAITGRLSGAGLGGSASLIPPISFTCNTGGGTVACDQTLFPTTSPPTYTVTFTNCQVPGSSGTLTINGTLTIADQQAEICLTAPPTAATITAQNLTIQMPNGTTATFSSGFSATVGLSCSSGSCSCVADTVTLGPIVGTITVTGNPSAQITFGDGSSITVSISTYNAECVPTVYDMEVDGNVTLITNGYTFAATYSFYDIYDDASSGHDMVDVDGDVTSACFGDTVTFSTSTDIALGNPCPSAGVVDVTANTSGNTDVITYSSSGVHIDFGAGGSADFGSCLNSGLFACPGS